MARIPNPSKNSKNHGENIFSPEPLVCYQSMVFQRYEDTWIKQADLSIQTA